MTKASKKFNFSQLDELKDSKYAAVYLEECLADGDIELFQAALQDVATAQGGMTPLAKETKLNRENLYRALSKTGKPKMETINRVLTALGLRLSITTVNNKTA